MSSLDRYLKSLIIIVWGAAIALRVLDIREVLGEGVHFTSTWAAASISPIWVDVLSILMSLIIIAAAVLLIGRARKAWIFLSIATVISKFVTVVADYRVGDLPMGDLVVTSLTTFIWPALVIILLVRSRQLLEVEAVASR